MTSRKTTPDRRGVLRLTNDPAVAEELRTFHRPLYEALKRAFVGVAVWRQGASPELAEVRLFHQWYLRAFQDAFVGSAAEWRTLVSTGARALLEQGYAVTDVAAMLGLTREQVKLWAEQAGMMEVSLSQRTKLRVWDSALARFRAGDESEHPAVATRDLEWRALVEASISALLQQGYGFTDISVMLGLSRERVRQLTARAGSHSEALGHGTQPRVWDSAVCAFRPVRRDEYVEHVERAALKKRQSELHVSRVAMIEKVRGLKARLGRDPTSGEICAAVKMPVTAVAMLWNPRMRMSSGGGHPYIAAFRRLRRLAGCAPESKRGPHPRPTRKRCGVGHLLNKENTGSHSGKRYCRRCAVLRAAERNAALKSPKFRRSTQYAVARRIQAARKQMALSRTALAKALGVSSTTVGRWESGEAAVTPTHQRAIARLLRIPAQALRANL